MANTENRGLPSINGLHRDKSNSQNSYDKIDTKTLKEMNVVFNGLSRYVSLLGGNLKDFDEIIEKSTKKLIDTKNNIEKSSKEYDSELAEMKKHYFGKNKKITDEYEKYLNKKRQQDITELEKTRDDIKKDLIKQSFKSESKRNQVRYLNSKFSKGNHLMSTSNEYYDELEKLKSEALDVYGENFTKNRNYQKALLNLNESYTKQMKESWKEDFKENHQILSSVGEGIKDTFEKNKEVLRGILGPLNLIIEPLKDFFGGFGTVFKIISGGVKTIFRKFTKKRPTATDVMKSGANGVGALYIANTMERLLGKTRGETDIDSSGLLGKFKDLTGVISALNGVVTQLGSIASVAGLAMVVSDAIKGWKMADEWGVSNIAGMLGSIVGGTSSGASGAVHGAIKYALLGAPFGLAGILVGGLVGGILGFFGGEFWSQNIQTAMDLLSGKTNITSLRKKSLLEDLEKRKQKGEISENTLNIMYQLADKLSDEDFASMGTNLSNKNWGGGLKGTVDQWLKGSFDSLNDEETISVLTTMLGSGFNINKDNLSTYKELFTKLHKSFNEIGLSNLYENGETLAWNLNKLQIISSMLNARKRGEIDIDEFSKSLEKLGFIGGVTSSSFGNLLKSGLLNVDLEGLDISGTGAIKKKNQSNEFLSDINYVNDAIIRTDGSIIKTNPKDTLVALKDIPTSIDKVRAESNKDLNDNLTTIQNNDLDNRLSDIMNVLSKILDKDVQIALPPQTRSDLDLIMSGGMI